MLYVFTLGKVNNVRGDIMPRLKVMGINGRVVEAAPTLKQGDICLCVGAAALKDLAEKKVVPKGRTIGSLREEAHVYGKGRVLVTYDPGTVYAKHELREILHWDLALTARLFNTGKLEPEFGKHYRYVDSFDSIVDKVKTLDGKRTLCCDLETVGLSPHKDDVWIVSIAFSWGEGRGDVMVFGPEGPTTTQLDEIRFLLTSPKVQTYGANFKFDQVWMHAHWGLTVTNFVFDTILVGSLIDENRSNSLSNHAKAYTRIGGYDTDFSQNYDKGTMAKIAKEEPKAFLKYSAGDVDAGRRVGSKLRYELLKDRKLTKFYVELLHPSAKAFAVMEQRGVCVDHERYLDLKEEVGQYIIEKEAEALSLMPRRLLLRDKHRGNVKLSRAALLQDFLFTKAGLNLTPLMLTKKTEAPSTAMEHLLQFSEHEVAGPFIQLLKEYNSASKTMGTYITGFLTALRNDGKFHPSYILHRGDMGGAVSGRTACKDPAFQTVPKHTIWAKPLRSVYVPPPGMAILSADYSQGELRVIACVAKEPTMLKAYTEGYDMHSVTAATLNGMTYEEFIKRDPEWVSEARFGGKAGNFGMAYGMKPKGFVAYAKATYGLDLSIGQASDFREKFFAKYSALVKWHADSISTAQKDRQIRSPLGRIRHLPLIHSRDMELRAQAERQSINSPIQSTLSDMTQYAMARLNQQYPELWIWGMTHDSLNFYVPEEDVDAWAGRIREVMETLPLHKLGWKPQLVFETDFEVSTTNFAESKGM